VRRRALLHAASAENPMSEGEAWGNIGVDYAAPALTPGEQLALNRGVPRASADAAGVNYMQRFFEPRGRTAAKVLTLHALDDGLVIPENDENIGKPSWRAAARSSSSSSSPRPAVTAGSAP